MANSITRTDLNQYTVLIDHLKDLYKIIKDGKVSVSSGSDFVTYHNLLFPTVPANSDTITYTNKLTTSSQAGASKGLTTLNTQTISLRNLLANTLDPTFNQTICSTSTYKFSNDSIITTDNTAGTKDHLCFIKINNDKTDIEPDEHPITNILYSKYAIEIFIKIIEALQDCYTSYENDILNLFTTTINIYIVYTKLKEEHTPGFPRGIYIKNNGISDNDTPPEGIYLYIGDLKNMFHNDNIKIVGIDSVAIQNPNKATYLNANTPIFTANNKLKYISGGNYYFGYLEYFSRIDGSSIYSTQSGVPANPPIVSTGTMTGVSLTGAKISAIIKTNSVIQNLKIHPRSDIQYVSSTPEIEPEQEVRNPEGIITTPARAGAAATYTYKIITGKISGTIKYGSSSLIKAGSLIENSEANNPKIVFTTSGSGVSGFTKTGTNPDASVKSGSSPTITVSTSLAIATDNIPVPSDITIPVPVSNGNVGVSVTEFPFVTQENLLPSLSRGIIDAVVDSSTTVIPVDISYVPIELTTTTPISITGTFANLEGTADPLNSYYKQNIYYIFNFIKMIKNIKRDRFSSTINYLRVYILCYKSLLLASIRAANIFYNNRYKLSAVAISYEKNFLNNSSQDPGGTDCGIISLNDFVKNDRKATFSSTAACTLNSNVLPGDTDAAKYNYILYKKSSGNQHDNESYFRKYDVLIQEELDNIKNNNIKSSTSSLGITNFKFFSSYKTKERAFKITCIDDNVNDKFVGGVFEYSTPSDEYDTIKKYIDDRNIYAFNNGYRINIEGTSFKVQDFSERNDNASPPNKRIDIELVQDNTIPEDLYDKLKTPSETVQPYPVYIVKITSKDIDNDYNAIVANTNTVEENINMYKTKIKNNTTLYELHKSRNNLLYNQVLSYLIIVAVIISILVIINVANVEKPLIKSITLACLAVIIILYMSYYIMNTLYIEEGFSQGSASSIYSGSGYELCNSNECKITDGTAGTGDIKLEGHTDLQTIKKDKVKDFLEVNAKNLTLMIILAIPTIINESLKGNNEKLVAISKHIYNDKLYLKDVLYSKKSDSEMNVDVLKYENKNYDIYIVCVLFLALIMVGSYTINIYTDNKYLDLLILIMVILFVCLFTYFVLYTNRVVRTVSTNYYWGNEYENQYI